MLDTNTNGKSRNGHTCAHLLTRFFIDCQSLLSIFIASRPQSSSGSASQRTEKREKREKKGEKGIKKGEKREKREKRGKQGKDGPGPVMVSDTLCPAVHILGT